MRKIWDIEDPKKKNIKIFVCISRNPQRRKEEKLSIY